MVQRPVFETSERDELLYSRGSRSRLIGPCRSIQGGYVDQTTCRPGAIHNRLSWPPSTCALVDPVHRPPRPINVAGWCGCRRKLRPSQVQVLRVWQPNIGERSKCRKPRSSLGQLTRKVPVQTCRVVNEEVVRKVPIQVCRMVQEEQVRAVRPYTTCRQVVERVENKVPVQVCRMVPEEVVRKVPVTTCKMAYEERVEQDPVRVCRQVAVSETVRIPQCVERRVPVTYTYRVPRTIVNRIPLDACGNDIVVADHDGAVMSTVAPSPMMVAPPSATISSGSPSRSTTGVPAAAVPRRRKLARASRLGRKTPPRHRRLEPDETAAGSRTDRREFSRRRLVQREARRAPSLRRAIRRTIPSKFRSPWRPLAMMTAPYGGARV